jgi:transcriptional regulator with XRE-family HTH domain
MNRIKEIRQRLGLSQEEFGKGIGCSQGNVGFIERGVQELLPDRARKLIEFARGKGHELTFDQVYGLTELLPIAAGECSEGEPEPEQARLPFSDLPLAVQRHAIEGGVRHE